jgi:predicted DNA-binding WGR domain protein
MSVISVDTLTNTEPGHSKFYEVSVEYVAGQAKPYKVVAHWGKLIVHTANGGQKQTKGQFISQGSATVCANELINNKLTKGYKRRTDRIVTKNEKLKPTSTSETISNSRFSNLDIE